MTWLTIMLSIVVTGGAAMVPLIIPTLTMYVFRKAQEAGIKIDEGHRAAYTAAATRAAGGLVLALQDGKVTSAELSAIWQDIENGIFRSSLPPPVTAAINAVQKGAHDALVHFDIADKPQAIASKVIGIMGGMVANATATPAKTSTPGLATQAGSRPGL